MITIIVVTGLEMHQLACIQSLPKYNNNILDIFQKDSKNIKVFGVCEIQTNTICALIIINKTIVIKPEKNHHRYTSSNNQVKPYMLKELKRNIIFLNVKLQLFDSAPF